MIGIKDVAKDAGVSTATVSYVLNGTKSVTPEVEQRVNASVKKLNYNANPVARSLRSKKSYRIGVMLQNIRNPFFPSVLAGMEEAARDYKYSLTFLNSNYDINVEKKNIEMLLQMRVDGIVLGSCVDESQMKEYVEFMQVLHKAGGRDVPLVLIERTLTGSPFSSVMVDNFSAAYEAAKHLIGIGRRKIVHYTSSYNWDILTKRREGYIQAMRDSGLDEHICIRAGEINAADGYNITLRLAGEIGDFDGLFAANDQMAIGALKALSDLKRSVPDDVAVMGFDNIEAASIVTPSLSTIDVPRFKMGYQSVARLIQQIETPGVKCEQVVVLNTKIVTRESTGHQHICGWDFREF